MENTEKEASAAEVFARAGDIIDPKGFIKERWDAYHELLKDVAEAALSAEIRVAPYNEGYRFGNSNAVVAVRVVHESIELNPTWDAGGQTGLVTFGFEKGRLVGPRGEDGDRQDPGTILAEEIVAMIRTAPATPPTSVALPVCTITRPTGSAPSHQGAPA